ncbi:MAG: hypothetical protein ACFFG0_24630 [Candidatus Thorarchaeota archaeon]
MKLYNSKKARELWTPDTFPFWMVFTIILGFTALFFLWIITPFATKTAEIPEGVEAYILMQRFTNSPNCFAYLDGTGRVYQKMIDLEKFTDENMKICYQTEDKEIPAFKLTLSIPGQDLTKSVKTPNWREGYLVKERSFKEVFIKFNGEVYKIRMVVDIQNA